MKVDASLNRAYRVRSAGARVCTTIFCFFARCDDFGVARVVGQAGSLRPIVNRPNVANVQHSSFAACRYVRQDGILRRVGNPPLAVVRSRTGRLTIGRLEFLHFSSGSGPNQGLIVDLESERSK